MAYDRYRQDQRPGMGDRDDRYSDRDYGTGTYRGQYGAGHNDRQQPRGGYDRDEDGYGNNSYGGGSYGGGSYGSGSYGSGSSGGSYGGQEFGGRGSYRSDIDRLATPRNRDYGRGGYGERDQGSQWQGRSQNDRSFIDRGVDEVRSWFGDDEAERRREADARADRERDHDYNHWRSGQIAALDRDYDEYRQENRSKFSNEFGSWRTDRQGQRDALSKVDEHMEVVGSDGTHVGTVDKVRGDRILLTKNDEAAGGRHHSIPSRWIQSVDDKVTLRKSAEEAKREWRDEERNQAFFGDDNDDSDRTGKGSGMLNRSFSGTY